MTITETARLLRERDDYMIITHMRPDGDTMGSAAALCHALAGIGKRAYVFNNPQFVDNKPWITEPFLAPEGYTGKFNIAVDIADEGLFANGFKGKADLCIDHHPSNSGYAERTLLNGEKASCGEIVMEVVKELCGGIDKTAADLLYIAVATDTGCFVYGNTRSDTLKAAAELCDAGAANTLINKVFFRTSSRERLLLEGFIFSTLRFFHSDKTVVAVVTRKMLEQAGATEKDCSDLAALPGRVEGTNTSVLVKEIDDTHCKVSLRTDSTVNANAVCRRFGGGGHDMAAGCSIDKSADEAVKLLVEAIGEEIGQ